LAGGCLDFEGVVFLTAGVGWVGAGVGAVAAALRRGGGITSTTYKPCSMQLTTTAPDGKYG